jgi:6-phosphogluconate dehydrogenase
VPIPTIGAALDARVLSSMKDERVAASEKLGGPSAKFTGDKQQLINAVQDALYASKVCSYAQGMSLIRAGSKEWNWNINLREMARIWTGGCIIRARLLADIMHAFDRDVNVANLLVESEFTSRVLESEPNWRKVVQAAAGLGIPTPAFSSSLAYFDSYRSAQLPQNLTQAQRDFFGAHTYQRADRPDAGFVHTDWQKLVHKK